ncbi:DNA polymerase III subunit alpha, partial [bacterium]|nr:DNA polymerase III subunit alpha [bacterium]
MSDFIHLHNHTHYSLLDGAIRIPDMIDKAIEFEMSAIAITDHGNMFGAIDFFMQAKKKGIKPIIGSEMYVAPGHRSERKTYKKESGKATYLHLVLLAKNNIGYKNLMKLSSIGYLEGYYYKPRIDLEVLEQYHEGLIASSACLHGAVSYTLLHNTYEAAYEMAKKYKDIFGDDYYIELQNHGLKEEIAIEGSLIKIARDLNIKLVATNDAHYLEQDHYRAHDVLLCLQTGKDYDDPKRMRYATDQLYLKSPQEMKALFKHVPEAIENTLEIAEKCNVEIDLSQNYLPNFKIPGGVSAEDYFRQEAYAGLKERYPVITPELTKRLDYEIGIINQMGFPSYFLIVKDFIDYARDKGIPVGPGRGSAAGSLAAYATRITNVDPMEYDLIFERFLNPERVTMPDIDIDFCYERREEVIDYVRTKYGENQVSQIITFGTMAAKAVVRDVGRVLKMPYSEVDRIAKLIPLAPKMNLEKAFDMVPELGKIAESDEVHHNLMDFSRTLEGLSRHQSTHACGVVITPTNLTDYIPLYRSSEGDITTQYEMKFLEEVGVLKMDFLGLRTLTVIADTLKALERRDIHVDVDKIPNNDPDAFDVFVKGQTIGIFQFESSGMQNYLKKLKPTCIQDLIAMNALYRPGPMSMIDDFIARKHGLMKMEYPHPMLEPILKETYGVIVYQEQVMRIASIMGGFTLGGADLLRRAMGHKKVELMKEQRVLFVNGAKKNGVDEATANDIFDLMDKFAGYGFNKSHAACYSVVAYQTAYLRAHYPAEFFAANLTSEMGNIDRIVILIDECRKIGINVLAPDVNESFAKFVAIDLKTIRFGLGAVKNVGLKPITAIVEGREKNGRFKTIFDFLRDIDMRLVNKKVLESLIQVGAMDSLEGHRAQLMETIDLAVSYAQRVISDKAMGQFNIFGSDDAEPGDGDIPPLPLATPWDKLDSLQREKELLGFYISGHPLKKYEKELKIFNSINFKGLKEAHNNQMVRVGGLITTVRTLYDRKGKTMAFVGIEDFSGSAEILVFSSVFSEYREQLVPDSMIMVLGKVSIREGEEPKILMEESLLLEYARERFTRNVLIDLDLKQLDDQFIESLTSFFKRNKGDCPVYFRVNFPGNKRKLIKSKRYLMDP